MARRPIQAGMVAEIHTRSDGRRRVILKPNRFVFRGVVIFVNMETLNHFKYIDIPAGFFNFRKN